LQKLRGAWVYPLWHLGRGLLTQEETPFSSFVRTRLREMKEPEAASGRPLAPPASLAGNKTLARFEKRPVSNPPPGWYADIDNPARRRWWDGGKWTEHLQPVEDGPLTSDRDTRTDDRRTETIRPLSGSDDGSGTSDRSATSGERDQKPTNPLATTGFTLGIAGLFLFEIPVLGLALTLGAAIFSALGFSDESGEMPKKYKVFAIVGLILGVVYFFMALIVMAGLRR
jgi:hypothetical protein